MTISTCSNNVTEKIKYKIKLEDLDYQGAVGEGKDDDKEKIDAYFGHTFGVKTLWLCQSIQNKIWNMLYEESYHQYYITITTNQLLLWKH